MLLAIDSSTQWVGLAIYDGAAIIGETIWQTKSHHTVELAPAIGELLNRCGVKSTELKALAVALGPGSFTSLRIGLAVVKGMSLALHLPVVGIPTLDILAAAQPVSNLPLAAVLQAGRKRLAIGMYSAGKNGWVSQGDAKVTTLEQFAESLENPTLIVGELTAAERQVLNRKKKIAILGTPAQCVRRPSYLAEMGWKRWQAGKVDEVISLAPIYLHIAEAIPS